MYEQLYYCLCLFGEIVVNRWQKLNKKAITYIKMAVSYEILVELKGLPRAYEVWEKLKATYEITTPLNQVHLMRKLVGM